MEPSPRNQLHFVLLILFGVWLTSCSGILESGSQPERTYWLEPLAGSDNPHQVDGPVLTVRVTVVPGLDSDHLLTIGPGPELSRFSAARWPGNLPEYVSSLLIRSLSATGRYTRVTRDAGAKLDACDLELEIDRFYTRLGESRDPQMVDISMAGTFQCGKAMHPLKIGHQQALSGNRVASVVAAHQQAMDHVMQELVARLEEIHRTDTAVTSD